MFEAISKIFAKASAPPPVNDPATRARLRAAQADVVVAEAAYADANAVVERTRARLTAADEAEAAQREAEEAAIAANADWAERGAEGISAEAEAAGTAAEQLRRRAFQARLAAKGAEAALSKGPYSSNGILADREKAATALKKAEEAVGQTASDVMFANAQPCIVAAFAAHAQLVEALQMLQSLVDATAGRGELYRRPYHGKRDPRLLEIVEELHKLPGPNSREEAELRRAWTAFGEALLKDPDAKLE